MATLTTLDELKQHITLLASVEQSDAPFISCYLNLEDGSDSWRETLEQRALVLRRILKGDDLDDFDYALDKVKSWLDVNLLPETKGVAIFVRGIFGGAFMLPLQFAAPLPNWIAIYPTPNIYHLVELKDNYDRYIVVIAMPDWVRILEVNLGAATTTAWLNNVELRQRVGSEWSRPHFQINQSHRGEKFLSEKISTLEKLMNTGGHSHLILAGDPEICQRLRRALPDDIVKRLIDVIPTAKRDSQADVILATLSSFIEYEEQESQTIAERLIEGLRNHNLAVVGTTNSLDALRWSEVDTLVMVSNYQPDPGWSCSHCQAIGTDVPETAICPQCEHSEVRPVDIRELLLRLAGQQERQVEIVEQSDALMALGGVGCLLRTHLETKHNAQTVTTAVSG